MGESPDPKRPKTKGEKMAETTSMEKYKPEDRGPFVLFAEKTDKSPLNAVTIGRQLKELGLLTGMIISIKNMKPNTIKILCENSKTANRLISSQAQLKSVRIFIPESHLYSLGTINNVPLDLTDAEILQNINCDGKITGVDRINRWNHEKQQLEPSSAIKITFREYMLPNKLNLFQVPFRVYYFIPQPLLCKSCKRFGHLKKHCKAPNTCQKCFNVHEGECTTPVKNCRYCENASHKTGNRECPETITQRELRKLMTINRISYKEAESRLDGRFNIRLNKNGKRIYNLSSPMDFPSLPPQPQKEGRAQQMLRGWQNPDQPEARIQQLLKNQPMAERVGQQRMSNPEQQDQILQLTQCKNHYNNLITKIIKNLEALDSQNPIIVEIKKMVNLIEGHPNRILVDDDKNE